MYDIEYLFGFKNNMDLNILNMVYNKNTIDNFKNIWLKFNDMLEFSERHENGLTPKVCEDFKKCKKYLTTYGFVFFSNIDYTNLSDNSYLWIVSLFEFVYNHLSERLKEKLIKVLEINIYKKFNINLDIIIAFITHPIFFNRYFVNMEVFSSLQLETSTLIGRLISPIDANIESNHPYRIVNQELTIKNCSVLFNYLYKQYPNEIVHFFNNIMVENQSKTRVSNQCYLSDSINTYNFLLNISIIINDLLPNNISDYDNYREPIYLYTREEHNKKDVEITNNQKLYWLFYEYYRITFYSLLQQNQNATIQSSLTPSLRDSYKIYIDANNKYLLNDIYYNTFLNYMYHLLCSDTFEKLDEDTLSEILYYWDNLVDTCHNRLSIVCKKMIYRTFSSILMNKPISNPFITIKLIKIIYLLEKFCNVDPKQILMDRMVLFYDRLCAIYIYIDKLVGLDVYLEKFFYKTNILEIILKNKDYTITNKQLIIILFNDIESTLEYLINSSGNLVTANFINNGLYDNYKNNCRTYLTRLKLRIEMINSIILSKNPLINELDVRYHLIKYYYGLLKNCFDKSSDKIKLEIFNKESRTNVREIWNIYLDNIIKPFSETIEVVFHIDDVVEMINRYYSDLNKYLKLMDKELVSDYNEIYRVIRLDLKERELPDDLPEEFLDPLLFTPIKDPVVLPESKIIMDKTVIEAHLVENKYDPFNRQPLTYEQLNEFNSLEEQHKKCIEFIQKRDEWIKTNHCLKCND